MPIHRRQRRDNQARTCALALGLVLALPAAAQVVDFASRPGAPATALGVQADAHVFIGRQAASADGRYVVFHTRATNLSLDDDKGHEDVFRKDLTTGALELVSSGASGPGNGDSSGAAISADGRYVVFSSLATNLTAGDANDSTDVFLRDMDTGTMQRVSVADDEQEADSGSYAPTVSDDGSLVAFTSFAGNLVASDTNFSEDVFVRDVIDGTTVRASVSDSEGQGTSGSSTGVLSGNGRYVAFVAFDGLDGADDNGRTDIYRRDLATSATAYVSIAGSVAANSGSGAPSISADGNLIAFDSDADNFDTDVNGTVDAFVRDMTLGTTTLVSRTQGGVQGFGGNFSPNLSRNGLYVAFDGFSPNLVGDDVAGWNDVFVKTLASGAVVRASVTSAGLESDGNSFGPAGVTNAGGVFFGSRATNLVAGDTNGFEDTYYRAAGTTVRASVTPAPLGIAADGESRLPVLSADGRYVVFESRANNLDDNDCGADVDVYRRDLDTGVLDRVGFAFGECGIPRVYGPDVSDDGNIVVIESDQSERAEIFVYDMAAPLLRRVSIINGDESPDDASSSAVLSGNATATNNGFVAFVSPASNYVAGDTNGVSDVFVRDLSSNLFERVSVATGGAQGDAPSETRPAISDDGRYVAFASRATNLVAGDTNAHDDVFVHDRTTDTTTRVSVSSSAGQGSSHSMQPSISADGRYVAFASAASDLVPDDTNGDFDVFVHDRITGETTRVSVATGGIEVDGDSALPRISGDGRFVAFASLAAIDGGTTDANGIDDVFVHDRLRAATWRASVDAAGTESASSTGEEGLAISEDGSRVAFGSNADEWTAVIGGYGTGTAPGVFVADVAATTLLSVDDTPDPSPVGATTNVRFAVGASSGVATGNVTALATTGESCTASLAVGVCQLTFTTPGTRTLDILYRGAPSYFPARAPFESHQVEPPGDADGFTGETPLVAPDGEAGDQAGMSVASSDDFVVVGAPNGADGDGAVYVFRRVTDVPPPALAKSVAGLVAAKDLVPVATLTNTGGALGDKWGSAVAISGDGTTIVIGAPEAGAGGAAFTFSRPGASWTSDSTPDASLVPAGGAGLGDKFGTSVAIGSGNMVAVGAPGAATGGNPGAGSATVFNGGTPTATLTPGPGADANANFGQSLAMSGGRLVIGAPNEGAGDNGAVRLYSVTADSVSSPTTIAPTGGAGIGDKFGTSVAIDGTTVVGGSPGATGGNGAGFVFQDTGGGFTQRGMLTGGDDAAGSAAGSAVSVSGDYILLGAPLADVGGNANQGRAFVFLQPDGGWADASSIGSLERANGAAGDGYGTAVVLTRRGAIVGIPNSDPGFEPDQGEADSFVVDRVFKATFE